VSLFIGNHNLAAVTPSSPYIQSLENGDMMLSHWLANDLFFED